MERICNVSHLTVIVILEQYVWSCTVWFLTSIKTFKYIGEEGTNVACKDDPFLVSFYVCTSELGWDYGSRRYPKSQLLKYEIPALKMSLQRIRSYSTISGLRMKAFNPTFFKVYFFIVALLSFGIPVNVLGRVFISFVSLQWGKY